MKYLIVILLLFFSRSSSFELEVFFQETRIFNVRQLIWSFLKNVLLLIFLLVFKEFLLLVFAEDTEFINHVNKLPCKDYLEESPDEGDLEVDAEAHDRDSKDVPGQGRKHINHPPEFLDLIALIREHVLHSKHLLVMELKLIQVQSVGF